MTDDSSASSAMVDTCVEALSRAIALPDARVIVRAHDAAIAEVMGELSIQRRGDWLRLGAESRPHVHVRASEVHGLELRRDADRNAALELRGQGGRLLLRVSFGRTNPTRPESFVPGRREAIESCFRDLLAAGPGRS